MEPSRQIMWNIGNHGFLKAATALAVASLAVGLAVRIAAWRRGTKGAAAGNRRARLVAALSAIATHEGMIRGRMYLVMHRCVFYGTLLLIFGSVMVALEMHLGLKLLRGATYLAFKLTLDVAGVAVMVGAGLAAWKRYVVRPGRLESSAGDAFLLVMLTVAVLSGFLVQGLRLIATSDPWAAWSPVGNAIAWLLGKTIGSQRATAFHAELWYGHVALAFTLIALFPWSKLLHLLAVPLNLYLSVPWAERASLSAPPDGSTAATGTIADCSRKQLVEADACVTCGRCKKLCSIYQGGIPFAPITMMKNMRSLTRRGNRRAPLRGVVVSEAALWSCTGCRSCEERCPMGGEHAARIVDIRRGAIGMGEAPQAVVARFTENETALLYAEKRRTVPDRNADVYLWPGCRDAETGEDAVLSALLTLLDRAGLAASVLEPPACCGGTIRRLGNESLFRRDAVANLGYLNAIEGKTIVTPCPHCFNTLKNEYPRFGGNFRVMHHSEYLAGLVAAGKLGAAKDFSLTATYHDPCFLGRYNDEFSAPRKLIGSAQGISLLEMKHNRRKSFCCGSGGGTVTEATALPNGRERLRQAVKEGAEAVITGCPYCRDNLAKAALEECPEKPLPILDIVELLI